MLAYITLGTNDLARSTAFYDQLLGVLGGKRAMQTDRYVIWSVGAGAMLGVFVPQNGEPATVGNGSMAALAAQNPALVNALHAKALALGGRCEGPPGPRGDEYHIGYFRDLDGNKLAAFFVNPRG